MILGGRFKPLGMTAVGGSRFVCTLLCFGDLPPVLLGCGMAFTREKSASARRNRRRAGEWDMLVMLICACDVELWFNGN